MEVMRVAYTLEQCWHRVPGGTGVAALRTAQALDQLGDVELIGVAGKHAQPPEPEWLPSVPIRQLPIASPWLYQTWLRLGWPRPESVVPDAEVVHATTLIPCPTRKPLVVTLHDLAFLHDPGQFTRLGNAVFRRSLKLIKRHADLVLCCSQATMDDSLAVGIGSERLRLVPLGVDSQTATIAEMESVRSRYQLPERFLLFVGTVEPRKNLRGLATAVQLLEEPLPLVVVGESGWGDAAAGVVGDVRFLGFVPSADLAPLYASALVFCYPSEREGYGLPVLEAMAQGTPVVTSAGTATEETAAGAAVLVDPASPADIARGIVEAIGRRDELSALGIERAPKSTWQMTAELTRAAYRELI
jgi:glycosyltransferase involved in cell wall biosynthesis